MEKYDLTTQIEPKDFITWANKHDINLDNIVLDWVDHDEHTIKTLQGWIHLCLTTYEDLRHDLDDPLGIIAIDNILLKTYQELIELIRQQVDEAVRLDIEEARKHV